jgi:hypothetical protein
MKKLKYEKARIEVYELDKNDVLMTSSPIPTEPTTEEAFSDLRENSYYSFFDLDS